MQSDHSFAQRPQLLKPGDYTNYCPLPALDRVIGEMAMLRQLSPKVRNRLRGLAFVAGIHENASVMNRPKGLALTAILMALCNAFIWATIKPGRPPYTQRMWLFFTFSICIGYLFIWFYWKGRNWARIAVLLVSFTSIVNLFSWNTVALSPALQTTPARIVLATRAVLGAALLYWLNTGPVVDFFKRNRVIVPPQFRG
jgi:hypothetical protein